jgi:hypothetical protein
MIVTVPEFDLLARLQRLYEDCPDGMRAFIAWMGTTPYGSITLRFADGRLQVVERTQTAK